MGRQRERERGWTGNIGEEKIERKPGTEIMRDRMMESSKKDQKGGGELKQNSKMSREE